MDEWGRKFTVYNVYRDLLVRFRRLYRYKLVLESEKVTRHREEGLNKELTRVRVMNKIITEYTTLEKTKDYE